MARIPDNEIERLKTDISLRVINYYHETLKQSPEALEYLESRGLKSAELIDTFKLGYGNRTLAYRLPEKNRKACAEIRDIYTNTV